MITTDPMKLCMLISEAAMQRDERLDRLERRERLALGLLNMEGSDPKSPENLAFGLWTQLAPVMLTSSPVMSCMSSGGHLEQLQAAAIQASGSQIAQKQRMQDALQPSASDFYFKGYACGFIEKAQADMSDLTAEERRNALGRLHSDEPRDVGGEADDSPSPSATATPRTQIPARWPRIKSLDPRICGWDCAGRSLAEARFTWHEVKVDHEDLMARANEHSDDWIAENVIEMAVDRRAVAGRVDREEVRYFVVYIPGGVLEGESPGKNQPGTIHTVAALMGDSGRIDGGLEIRRPFYWEGHPGGPHIFGGQYVNGLDSFFNSILSGAEDGLAMLDAMGVSVRNSMARHKTVIAFDSTSQEAVEELAAAADGEWRAVPGLERGLIQPIEVGQVTPAQVAELREAQDNAARQMGIDDSGRGAANADATATAVSVAANASQTKLSHFIQQWTNFVRDCMERMAWEIAHDDRVAIRLNESGREQYYRAQLMPLTQMIPELGVGDVEALISKMKSDPILFQGGDFASEDGELNWHSLDITIQPHSLDGSFGDRAVARISTWAQFLAFAGQQMVTQPHIRWVDIIKQMGQAYGMANSETIADIELAQQIAQMQINQGTGSPEVASETLSEAGPTLRESGGGARSPAGVDPGGMQTVGE